MCRYSNLLVGTQRIVQAPLRKLYSDIPDCTLAIIASYNMRPPWCQASLMVAVVLVILTLIQLWISRRNVDG